MAKERKHPKGLMVLFFTEMWERFGFYLMLGIFTLYMINGKNEAFPGLGFSLEKSADIYGTYLALVYLTPFFGGLLADRLLGYRLSVTIGGILFSIGYIGLSIYNETTFYISLLLIILGNGLFKPNISTLVGKLYDNNEKYRPNKDAGYNIFYMGINVGAFVCNFVAAYLRINYGWGWAFAAAGIGMIVGLIWFWSGQAMAPEIINADKIEPPKAGEQSLGKTLIKLFAPAFGAAFLGWIIPGNVFGADSTDAFIFFCIPLILFYINLYRAEYKEAFNNKINEGVEAAKLAAKKVADPIKALLAIYGCVIVFWAIFHQNGSALTIWAENYTSREVPAFLVKPAKTLSMIDTVTTELREVALLDGHGVPVLDESGKPIVELGPDPYFNNIPKEEWPENGEKYLLTAELFQSVNPGFIIIFTPLVVGFFIFLRRKNRNVSTPAKIGYGLLITALSALVMVVGAIISQNGSVKASAAWLFGVYGVITIGELCLSPMGLSITSKLSPPKIAALMMGGWFLSTAIGNKLSGVLSGLWNLYEKKALFFLTNTGLAMISVVLIFSLLPWLRRVYKGKIGDD